MRHRDCCPLLKSQDCIDVSPLQTKLVFFVGAEGCFPLSYFNMPIAEIVHQ